MILGSLINLSEVLYPICEISFFFSLHILCYSNSFRYATKVWFVSDLPGGPMIKTPRFHCRGHGFDPWSGKFRLPLQCGQKRKEYVQSLVCFNDNSQ